MAHIPLIVADGEQFATGANERDLGAEVVEGFRYPDGRCENIGGGHPRVRRAVVDRDRDEGF